MLNEAGELFDKKNYEAAKDKAAWVLEMDPFNQKALRIEGLIEYNQSDYTQALEHLKKLQNPDPLVLQALAVSEILSGDSDKRKKNAGANHKFFESGYLPQIGVGALNQHDARESVEWFSKISKPSQEVIAGKFYAYYESGDWSKALDYYHQLAPPYSELLGLKTQPFNPWQL